MSMSKAKTKMQVSRLVSLPAKDKEAFGVEPQQIRNDLGSSLERFCSSDDEAQRVVDWLVFTRDAESRKFRPAPGEIPDAVREVREIEARGSTTGIEGCDICDGQPWITITRRIIDPVTKQAEDRLGSQRCHCDKGQWFRQKDRENNAKREAGQPV